MYIDRIKAIEIAIEAIEQLPPSKENAQAVLRLNNMKAEDKFNRWTKEKVFEKLNEWKGEHGRNPTVTDLVEPGMPKAVTIKQLFDMKASAFMNAYYPSETAKPIVNKYSIRSREEWIEDFKRQFDSIRPASAKDYDAKRDKNTPTWVTIARYCKVSSWNELLRLTEVDTSCLRRSKNGCERKITYTVISHSPLDEKLDKLLDCYREMGVIK